MEVDSHIHPIQKANSQTSYREIAQEREDNSPLKYSNPADSGFPLVRGEKEVPLADKKDTKLSSLTGATLVLQLSNQSAWEDRVKG